MKRPICVLLMLVCLVLSVNTVVCGNAAEEKPIPFATSVELKDGEGRPVAILSIQSIETGEGEVCVAYALVNHGENALTQLNYTVTYLDGDGADLCGKPLQVMIGLMKEPVQPGETREFEKRHYFDGAENAAAVVLTPIDVKDEVELPPWTDPRPGNLLLDFCNYPPFSACFENLDTNPPVKMQYHVDQSVDETITDTEQIIAVIESLKAMRVGEESDIRITDSGISYWFTMADGMEWGVSFEAPGLFCWHGKVYEVIRD